jgi:hypothetical protein
MSQFWLSSAVSEGRGGGEGLTSRAKRGVCFTWHLSDDRTGGSFQRQTTTRNVQAFKRHLATAETLRLRLRTFLPSSCRLKAFGS